MTVSLSNMNSLSNLGDLTRKRVAVAAYYFVPADVALEQRTVGIGAFRHSYRPASDDGFLGCLGEQVWQQEDACLI